MAESDLWLVEAQFRHPYCEDYGLLKDDCECEEDPAEQESEEPLDNKDPEQPL